MEQPDRFMIDFRTDLGGYRFPKQVELHLYRMISELVHNTVKHSGASRATVVLKKRNHKLTLHYTDNGKGYDVDQIRNQPGGLGVGNIIHRAMLIDAKIGFRRRKGYTLVTLEKYF
jgi:signal transduction histidine kinase